LISVARLRRAARRETIGVDVGAALNLVGTLIKWFSLTFLFPAAIAIGYGERPWIFLVPAAISAALGVVLELTTSGKERVEAREGFLVVSLLWVLIAVLGGVPYLLSGDAQLSDPANAIFESMSGFTTTGSSILTDIPALSRSLLMWRQFTQWVGGMGIVVLALAILPRLRIGGRQSLFQFEVPGPELASFSETIRDTARRFVVLYAAITAVEMAVFSFLTSTGIDSKMTFYDAVAHSFTTISTGGFSNRGGSIGELGAAGQWAMVPFMICGAANFALLYRGIVRRKAAAFLRDDEFRTYLVVLALASSLVLGVILSQHIASGEAAVRQAVVNTVSVYTTTGYANADFNKWIFVTSFVLLGGMLISGCAGSTSGGIKLVRHVAIAKLLRRELDQTVHPELVAPIRVNRRPIDERALRAIVVFAFVYVGVLVLATTILMIDALRTGLPLTPFQALAAAATTQGNCGPAFGFAGPLGSFDPFSDFSKAVLTALMWLGRLEIITVLVLFTRRYWRA
jgi:trk system potassium uptake protein TrkH